VRYRSLLGNATYTSVHRPRRPVGVWLPTTLRLIDLNHLGIVNRRTHTLGTLTRLSTLRPRETRCPTNPPGKCLRKSFRLTKSPKDRRVVGYAIDPIAIALFRFQKSGDYIGDPATRRNFVPQVADVGWGHVEATSERGSKRPHGSTIKSFLDEHGHIPLRVVEVRSLTRLLIGFILKSSTATRSGNIRLTA